jgi:hypothetical protein
MAKKKAAAKSSPAAKGRAAKGRTVSVKKIVAEIDRALAKLEPKYTTVQARGKAAAGMAPDHQAHSLQRAIMSLRGARDVIEGTCVPGFDIPF